MTPRTGDLLEAAPKVELHLHLEGAIPLAALWTLIERHGGDPTVASPADLADRFVYTDFTHFIETWTWMTDYLTTPDDFSFAARAVATSLVRQNIVYAEASFSPVDFDRHGLSTQEIGLAIRRGLDFVPDVVVNLNVDLVRDRGPVTAGRTLDDVLEIAEPAGIKGVTIGGSEQLFPPEPFAEVFARAAAAGLRRTAHAGEAAGPESVRAALDMLDVERLGHGVRSVEDRELVGRIVADQIPLEVCPTSNLRTGVARSWDTHQLGQLLEAGAVVTISSDDPVMFDCSVAGELRAAVRHWPDLADAEQLTLAAVRSSWLDPADRDALSATITSWWAAQSS